MLCDVGIIPPIIHAISALHLLRVGQESFVVLPLLAGGVRATKLLSHKHLGWDVQKSVFKMLTQ